MTNREKLMNTNIYELLVKIDGRLPEYCILMVVPGGYDDCPKNSISPYDPRWCSCEECIQKWLNEEE